MRGFGLFPCDSCLDFESGRSVSRSRSSVSRSRSPVSRSRSPVSRSRSPVSWFGLSRSRSPSPVCRRRSGFRSPVYDSPEPPACRSGSTVDCCSESAVSRSQSLYPLRSRTCKLVCKEGRKIDIVSLLCSSTRNFLVDKDGNKISVSSLLNSGKYIIFHSLELPVDSFSEDGELCWALKAALSTPLWSNYCQLVVALSMSSSEHLYRYNYKDNDELFYSFLSALPNSLAIPLWDSASSNRLSKLLRPDPGCAPALILDPNHTVLAKDCDSINNFGAESFPFTEDHISTLLNTIHDDWSIQRPVLLEDLLGLRFDDSLSNLDATATTTVSDLKGKLVGLYLLRSGTLFDTIDTVYKQCQAKHRELEIVVVYFCFNDNPLHYMASANAFLVNQGISSWWLLPFNDSTNRKLWNLCQIHPVDNSVDEKFVIVGPQGRFLEINGVNFITKFDPIYDMYPYATEFFAQQETARLQNLTLESLLCASTTHEHEHDCLLTLEGDHIPVKQLQGKRVLLFIANLHLNECRPNFFDAIMKAMTDWCTCNKKYYRKCCADEINLVFVPVLFSNEELPLFSKDIMSLLRKSTMPWLICPPGDPVREARIVKDITLYGLNNCGFDDIVPCLSFQEDGRIVSVECPKLLSHHDWDDDQLYSQLFLPYEDNLNLIY